MGIQGEKSFQGAALLTSSVSTRSRLAMLPTKVARTDARGLRDASFPGHRGSSPSPRGPAAFGAEGPITAPDYARVIWKYRWFILGLCLVAVLTTGILTLQSSKIYQAKATLLVPKEGGSGGLIGTLATSGLLLQQLPGLSAPSLTPNRDIVISILKSRSLS